MSSKKQDQGQNDVVAARAERLAAALRENLHRRKAQDRVRKAENADSALNETTKKDRS